MKCIFCKTSSDASTSREHILPESLGNRDHWLPPGAVCDDCNNYFAVKLEAPLLETDYFTALRHRQGVPNKRGRMPIVRGLFPAARIAIGLQRTEAGLAVGPWRERDNTQFVRTLQSLKSGSFYVPHDGPVDERVLSRFIAKIAVEMMAHAYLRAEESTDQLLEMGELEAIRQFVRRGDRPPSWPVHRRRLYPEDAIFGPDGYQVLHEFDLLWTDANELYAVICLFGEEFAINLGGPSIEGYEAYLRQQDGRSPLYKAGELDKILFK